MMTNYYSIFEEKVLRYCQKPARYIGNEINAIKKDWSKVNLKWGLLFPDLYELGSSNLGISILYSILNNVDDILAERFFMPATDAIKLMEQYGIPPLSLESKLPAKEFDVIGITLPYELTVTNILKFLEMSQIPIKSSDRRAHPVIIGGGTLAFNPLPLSPFFDAFVIGDGEDAIIEISDIIKKCKHDRDDLLARLAMLPYVFVPAIHDKKAVSLKRAVVTDLNKVDAGTPLVPLIETTFNRLSIEAARGCTRGCRFCFAGMTQRPYRERDISKITNLFTTGLVKTGFDEFSPSSLSITDFSDFPLLFDCLYKISDVFKASLSLPSLRVGSIKDDLAKKISTFRKTGLTVAPETYPSFQTALNKNVCYEDLKKDIKTAFSMGWLNIKLYYMIGLPDEKLDGFYEIKEFAKSILQESHNRANITLSFSTFVPKPHTPLQWCRMNSLEEIQEKQKLLKDLFFREKKIFLRLHNPHMSILEGVISRGDESVSKVIFEAFREGAIFDAWDEHINFNYWQEAFRKVGITIDDCLKGYHTDETLPWDFIQTGVSKKFLISEYEKYFKQEKTPDCRFDKCSNCGACDFKHLKNIFSKKQQPVEIHKKVEQTEKKRYLVVYQKKAEMRFLGNLDIMRLWHRVLKISGVPLLYSQGFNPQPIIDGGWALPLGMESECEVLVFEAEKFNPEKTLTKFDELNIKGLKILKLSETAYKESVDKIANKFQFMLDGVYNFDNSEQIVVKRKDKEKLFKVNEFVTEVVNNCGKTFFTIVQTQGGLKPLEFASYLANREVTPFELTKVRVFFKGGESFGT